MTPSAKDILRGPNYQWEVKLYRERKDGSFTFGVSTDGQLFTRFLYLPKSVTKGTLRLIGSPDHYDFSSANVEASVEGRGWRFEHSLRSAINSLLTIEVLTIRRFQDHQAVWMRKAWEEKFGQLPKSFKGWLKDEICEGPEPGDER
jgi:hypothetical protein